MNSCQPWLHSMVRGQSVLYRISLKVGWRGKEEAEEEEGRERGREEGRKADL